MTLRMSTPYSGGWKLYGIPLLFFTAFSVLMTWPLAPHVGTHVIGGAAGDNWYYVWLIGWLRKALFEYGVNPLYVPQLNSPQGWNLAYSETTLSNLLIALPPSLMVGSTFGYNFALLLSFVLSGLMMYWWVLSLTGNVAAALVGGSLFAFAPYRLAHAYGHLPLMGTQWLVLYFWGLHSLLQKRAFHWRTAAMSGIGLGLAASSSMYYLYMSLIVSAVFILGYVLLVERRAFLRRIWWRNGLVGMLIAFPLLLGAVGPYLQLSAQGEANHRLVGEVDVWSASPTDFFLPAPVHPIWGNWILENFARSRWIEQTVYVGAVSLMLICAPLTYRKGTLQHNKTIGLLVWGSIWSIVFAMGTSLHWLEQPVRLGLPGFTGVGESVSVPLPGRLLFQFLPFYDGMRVWLRYGIYLNLFTSVLAGIGYGFLAQRVHSPLFRRILLCGTISLIALDFLPGLQPLSQVKTRPVDEWLASQPLKGAVAQFPIERALDPTVIYGTLFYPHPFVGMFYGAYLPADFSRVVSTLKSFPDTEAIRLLADKNVAYVLVDSSQYPDWGRTRARIQDLGMTQIRVVSDQYVYQVQR